MEKFTKGEWRIMPLEGDKEYIRIRGSVLGGRFKVANVSDLHEHHDPERGWCKIEREESMANAHLIAAAPEMYAMLKEILEVYEMDYDDTSKALKILEKARGEK